MAEEKGNKEWIGNGDITADKQGTPSDGIATETNGREDNPKMYENDIFEKIIKRKKNDIWSRGNEKRVRHKEDE